MFLSLSHRAVTWVNEMPYSRVPTYQDKLLKSGTGTARFEQPKKPLDCYVHDLVWGLFARGQMDDVCHAVHRFFHSLPMFDGAVHILYAFICVQFTAVAQSFYIEGGKFWIRQQALDKYPAHL